MATAWHIDYSNEDTRPYLLVTSHLPDPDLQPGKLLRKAQEAGLFFAVLDYTDIPDAIERLDQELS